MPLLPAGRVGDGHDDEHTGHRGVGAPGLDAVQHVRVALPDGAGAQVGGVGAGLGLGQGERPEALPRGHGRQVFLLLFLGSAEHDGIAGHGVVDGHGDRQRGVHPGDLFDDEGVGQVVDLRAAQVGRHQCAHEAEPGQLVQQGRRELAVRVPIGRARPDFRLGEIADRLPDQPLVFRPLEIQKSASRRAIWCFPKIAGDLIIRSSDLPLVFSARSPHVRDHRNLRFRPPQSAGGDRLGRPPVRGLPVEIPHPRPHRAHQVAAPAQAARHRGDLPPHPDHQPGRPAGRPRRDRAHAPRPGHLLLPGGGLPLPGEHLPPAGHVLHRPARDPVRLAVHRVARPAGGDPRHRHGRARPDPGHRHHRQRQVHHPGGHDQGDQPRPSRTRSSPSRTPSSTCTARPSPRSSSARSAPTPTASPRPCAPRCARTPTSSWWARCATSRPSTSP